MRKLETHRRTEKTKINGSGYTILIKVLYNPEGEDDVDNLEELDYPISKGEVRFTCIGKLFDGYHEIKSSGNDSSNVKVGLVSKNSMGGRHEDNDYIFEFVSHCIYRDRIPLNAKSVYEKCLKEAEAIERIQDTELKLEEVE
jgi:hypothetical protein